MLEVDPISKISHYLEANIPKLRKPYSEMRLISAFQGTLWLLWIQLEITNACSNLGVQSLLGLSCVSHAIRELGFEALGYHY